MRSVGQEVEPPQITGRMHERASRANESKESAVSDVRPLVGKCEIAGCLNTYPFRKATLMKCSPVTNSDCTLATYNKSNNVANRKSQMS